MANITITAGTPIVLEFSYSRVTSVNGMTGAITLNVDVQQRTGTAILFDANYNYGTIATPETGNITASFAGAKIGISQLIIHNNATEPTYPSEFKKSSLSGTYVGGSVNYIYCEYLDSTHVIYSISQSA